METEVRFRLSALEERSRETHSLCLALKAVVSALPEISQVQRAGTLRILQDLVKSLPDAPALELKARQQVDEMLSSPPPMGLESE